MLIGGFTSPNSGQPEQHGALLTACREGRFAPHLSRSNEARLLAKSGRSSVRCRRPRAVGNVRHSHFRIKTCQSTIGQLAPKIGWSQMGRATRDQSWHIAAFDRHIRRHSFTGRSGDKLPQCHLQISMVRQLRSRGRRLAVGLPLVGLALKTAHGN